MTHECVGGGEGEPKYRIYVDEGKGGSLIPRGSTFDTEAEAQRLGEYFRRRWGPAYAEREFRVVQVCPLGDGWRVCGGRDAVQPKGGPS